MHSRNRISSTWSFNLEGLVIKYLLGCVPETKYLLQCTKKSSWFGNCFVCKPWPQECFKILSIIPSPWCPTLSFYILYGSWSFRIILHSMVWYMCSPFHDRHLMLIHASKSLVSTWKPFAQISLKLNNILVESGYSNASLITNIDPLGRIIVSLSVPIIFYNFWWYYSFFIILKCLKITSIP
jgi:hypothetical protein